MFVVSEKSHAVFEDVVILSAGAKSLFRVQASQLTLRRIRIETGSTAVYAFVLQFGIVDVTDFTADQVEMQYFISNAIDTNFSAT
jgi:hypothetical protein